MKTQRWYGVTKTFYILFIFAVVLASASCSQNVAYIDKFGDVDVSTGNYDEAIKDYTKAINYKPTDPDGYIGRAYVYQKMGNHRLAIEDYSKAIGLLPDDSNLYFARGSAYELLGNNDQSVRDYQTAAALGSLKARNVLSSKGIRW